MRDIDDHMAKKLQQLRRFRNRVHIKTVEELECASYRHGIANGTPDILEEFRLVANAWIVNKTAEDFNDAMAALAPAATQFATEKEYDFNPTADDFEFDVHPDDGSFLRPASYATKTVLCVGSERPGSLQTTPCTRSSM
jgi:hypothetical protein